MKTVMLLASSPLVSSQAVDEYGYLLRHKLIYGLSDGDLSAIKKTLALTEDLSICALGAVFPREALYMALAHGAHEAFYIGAEDWPEQPAPTAAALALRLALGQKLDMFVTSDQGDQAVLAAWVAANAGIPFFNSLISAKWQDGKLCLLRKLEKGQRQVIIAEPPLALAFIPVSSCVAPPGLSMQAEAGERPIIHKHVFYYDCLRRAGGAEAPAWQPMPLRPAATVSGRYLNDSAAEARLDYLLQGTAKARAGRRVSGSTQECAGAIIDYMLQEGFITEK